MKFLVFHLRGSWLSRSATDFTTENYEPVAVVDVPASTEEEEGLDQVFERTNTIDRAWTKNPGLALLGMASRRSTSVNDIIATESGRAFRCMPAGWKEIDSPEIALARPFAKHLKKGDLETLVHEKWNENEAARDRLVAAGLLVLLGAYSKMVHYERTHYARKLGCWEHGTWVFWPLGRAITRLLEEGTP